MPRSDLTFVIATNLRDCLNGLDLSTSDDVVTCIPSSLNRMDRLATAVREVLRTGGIPSHLLLPDSPVTSLIGSILVGSRSTSIGSGGRGNTGLPDRLMDATVVWAMIDIDAVADRGPYALDLLVRFANPVRRLHIIGSRTRAERAVSLLKARPVSRFIICRQFSSFTLVADTCDPIVAELVALALVDEDLTRDHEVVGPWEDDLVQRATEQDLGANLPSNINVLIKGVVSGPPFDTIQRICDRIGVTIR